MTTTEQVQPSATVSRELLAFFEKLVHGKIEEWEKWREQILQNGDSDALHDCRNKIEAGLAYELGILDYCLAQAERQPEVLPADIQARMLSLRDHLATHYNSLFPRWQTLEDLECILLAPLTPSKAHMDMLVANYPPPQSWFEESVDPFEPEKAQ